MPGRIYAVLENGEHKYGAWAIQVDMDRWVFCDCVTGFSILTERDASQCELAPWDGTYPPQVYA